jgi:hypothetical protein
MSQSHITSLLSLTIDIIPHRPHPRHFHPHHNDMSTRDANHATNSDIDDTQRIGARDAPAILSPWWYVFFFSFYYYYYTIDYLLVELQRLHSPIFSALHKSTQPLSTS